jgi:hypothetical protein
MVLNGYATSVPLGFEQALMKLMSVYHTGQIGLE